jgi:hypothetical protein
MTVSDQQERHIWDGFWKSNPMVGEKMGWRGMNLSSYPELTEQEIMFAVQAVEKGLK